MINSINPSADSFLVNINRLQAKAEHAQQQISSGLRVINASDDPDQVGALVETGSSLARNAQIGRNLDRTKSEVDSAETALSTAISTLEKITVLGAQGANFNQTAAARSEIATEVQNLLGQLVGNANTNVERRYVFGGDSDQVAPYSIDLTTATGTSPYAGTPATRQVEDPRGGTFSISNSPGDFRCAGRGERIRSGERSSGGAAGERPGCYHGRCRGSAGRARSLERFARFLWIGPEPGCRRDLGDPGLGPAADVGPGRHSGRRPGRIGQPAGRHKTATGRDIFGPRPVTQKSLFDYIG